MMAWHRIWRDKRQYASFIGHSEGLRTQEQGGDSRVFQALFPGGLPYSSDLPLHGHMCRYLGYLFRQCGEDGTFHRYYFHIQSFLLVSAAKFGNKRKGL